MMFGNELHDSSTACGLSITQQCVESICELLQTSAQKRTSPDSHCSSMAPRLFSWR